MLPLSFHRCIFVSSLLLFTRVKQASRGKHEWASLPVPTSKDNLLVTGLLAATNYQFSVLPQNKLGSGPFSEIVSVRTRGGYHHHAARRHPYTFTRLWPLCVCVCVRFEPHE